MTSNPEPIVQHLQQEFQNLLASVTGAETRLQTAYPVEFTLSRRLLALGAALLRLFFVTRAAGRPAEPGRSTMTSCRWLGVVGLNVLSAMAVPYKPVVTSMR